MKNINKIVLLIIVSCLVVTDASSQSFWKKLEKGLENVGKEIDKLDKAVNPESEKNAQSIDANAQENSSTATGTESDTVQPTTVKYDNIFRSALHGNVKEVVETNTWGTKTSKNIFRFNEHGQLTSLNVTSYNGNVNIKIDYEYADHGRIVKRIFLKTQKSDDQKLLGAPNEFQDISINEPPFDKEILSLNAAWSADSETTVYSYDKNGTLVKKVETNPERTLESYYNTEGLLIRFVEKEGNDTKEKTYNSKGVWTGYKVNGKAETIEDYGDEYGEEYGEPTLKYDAKGRLISSTGDAGDIFYSYNAAGFISLIKHSDRWWGTSTHSYTAYVYDVQKNWTKRTMKKTGEYYGKTGLIITTTRTVIYY